MLTFKHSGARGDLIYGLPVIKALNGGTLCVNLSKEHYVGKPMECQDVLWLKDLLKDQTYIHDVVEWDGNYVTHDIDKFRLDKTLDYRSLAQCQLSAFGLKFDLSQPWIDPSKFTPNHIADIVICRSARYHGSFPWQELIDYDSQSVFMGYEEEYNAFVEQTGIKVPWYTPSSYRDMVEVILGSKLFVGNQSFPYSLAEALKHPRVLEVCSHCPNCMPNSDNGYIRLDKGILDYYVGYRGWKPEQRIGLVHVPPRMWRVVNQTTLLPKQWKPVSNRPLVTTVFIKDASCSETLFKHNMIEARTTQTVIVENMDLINSGMVKSEGDFIVMVPSGFALSLGWIQELVNGFSHDRVGIVFSDMEDAITPCNCVFMVSRMAYGVVGGFDMKDTIEDMLSAYGEKLKCHGYSMKNVGSLKIK